MTHATFTPHFNAYRFYDSDGGEAASTALNAQNTNVTIDVSSGNASFQLRIRVDETGGADGTSTDDWQIAYSRNSGGYNSLTTTDTGNGIRAVAAGLTNDNATTNRSSEPISDPGAGSFVAGEQSSDGLVDDMLLTQNDFTEHVYGIELVAANVADGDTFDFQLTLPSEIVNNVTARATVQKTAPITGTFAETLGGISLNGDGEVLAVGTFTETLAGISLNADGTVLMQGNYAATLDDVALNGAGTVDIAGSAARTLDDVALDGSGTVSDGVSGAFAKILGGITLDGAGSVEAQGDFNTTLGDLVLSGAGETLVAGDSAKTLAGMAMTATGGVESAGSYAKTMDGTAMSGSGVVGIAGSFVVTLGDASLGATGGVIALGSYAKTLGDAVLAAAGAVGTPVASELRRLWLYWGLRI